MGIGPLIITYNDYHIDLPHGHSLRSKSHREVKAALEFANACLKEAANGGSALRIQWGESADGVHGGGTSKLFISDEQRNNFDTGVIQNQMAQAIRIMQDKMAHMVESSRASQGSARGEHAILGNRPVQHALSGTPDIRGFLNSRLDGAVERVELSGSNVIITVPGDFSRRKLMDAGFPEAQLQSYVRENDDDARTSTITIPRTHVNQVMDQPNIPRPVGEIPSQSGLHTKSVEAYFSKALGNDLKGVKLLLDDVAVVVPADTWEACMSRAGFPNIRNEGFKWNKADNPNQLVFYVPNDRVKEVMDKSRQQDEVAGRPAPRSAAQVALALRQSLAAGNEQIGKGITQEAVQGFLASRGIQHINGVRVEDGYAVLFVAPQFAKRSLEKAGFDRSTIDIFQTEHRNDLATRSMLLSEVKIPLHRMHQVMTSRGGNEMKL